MWSRILHPDSYSCKLLVLGWSKGHYRNGEVHLRKVYGHVLRAVLNSQLQDEAFSTAMTLEEVIKGPSPPAGLLVTVRSIRVCG